MDLQSLSQRSLSGVAKLEEMGIDSVKRMCKFILQVVTVGDSNLEIQKEHEDVLAALSTLFIEFSRNQMEVDDFRKFVADHIRDRDIAIFICTVYEQHRSSFIQYLSKTDIDFPTIVNLSWRLNYEVRSRYGGRENIPVFFVSLEVKDRGLLRYVDMMLSHEQMLDFSSKVRDAIKQVDRVLVSS